MHSPLAKRAKREEVDDGGPEHHIFSPFESIPSEIKLMIIEYAPESVNELRLVSFRF